MLLPEGDESRQLSAWAGFSSVALKVQAVEGGVPLKGLPNQTWSGSSWNGLIALLSSLVNE